MPASSSLSISLYRTLLLFLSSTLTTLLSVLLEFPLFCMCVHRMRLIPIIEKNLVRIDIPFPQRIQMCLPHTLFTVIRGCRNACTFLKMTNSDDHSYKFSRHTLLAWLATCVPLLKPPPPHPTSFNHFKNGRREFFPFTLRFDLHAVIFLFDRRQELLYVACIFNHFAHL